MPNCTVTATPSSGEVPLTTTIDASKPSWAKYTLINYGDGKSWDKPTFPHSHTYDEPGEYTIEVRVQNNISSIAT